MALLPRSANDSRVVYNYLILSSSQARPNYYYSVAGALVLIIDFYVRKLQTGHWVVATNNWFKHVEPFDLVSLNEFCGDQCHCYMLSSLNK